jgi:hypothetical protein
MVAKENTFSDFSPQRLDCLSILFGILEIKIYKRLVGQPSSLLALLTWANWTIRSSIPDKHGT